MTDYVKGTDFLGLRGSASDPAIFDTEFNLVASASASKSDSLNPTFSGAVVIPALSAIASYAGDNTKTTAIRSSEVYMHTFPTGTKMAFFQALAPIGWTQDVANNDALLRVVNTAGGGIGGSSGFVGAPLSVTDGHILTVTEMPSHTHTQVNTGQKSNSFDSGTFVGGVTNGTTGSTGGDAAHTHPISWTPKYIDMIICVKD